MSDRMRHEGLFRQIVEAAPSAMVMVNQVAFFSDIQPGPTGAGRDLDGRREDGGEFGTITTHRSNPTRFSVRFPI